MNNGTLAPRFVALAAVDTTLMAQEVVRVAANFAASAAGGELHLLRVLDEVSPVSLGVPPPLGLGATTGETGSAAQQFMDTLSSEARTHFAGRLASHLANGSAPKQILQVAIDLEADVILVGTHGRTGISRLLLGSVAEEIARKASCPVVVVRPKDYHTSVPPGIEPACPDCLRVQRETAGARLWCDRHAEHHPRAHRYYDMPDGFGHGWQLLG